VNRAQRRAAARHPDPRICEHGNPKKTDGRGIPVCPHWCGFEHLKPITSHDFQPVEGHPDDDECTHRSDGTDATYCGEPRGRHGT
jgi:hypothetical protein